MGSTLKMRSEPSPRSRAAGSFKKDNSEVTVGATTTKIIALAAEYDHGSA
jgi:hypothetical protein